MPYYCKHTHTHTHTHTHGRQTTICSLVHFIQYVTSHMTIMPFTTPHYIKSNICWWKTTKLHSVFHDRTAVSMHTFVKQTTVCIKMFTTESNLLLSYNYKYVYHDLHTYTVTHNSNTKFYMKNSESMITSCMKL